MRDDLMEPGPTMGRMYETTARTEANLRAFRAYWEACRRGEDVPYRSNIDPRGLEPLISNAFVAERIAPGVVRLRVAGMHLNDLMGMEVRGMPLASFIAPSDRDAFALRLVELFDGPAILRFALREHRRIGQPAFGGTLMLLPLRSDLGNISRALGCLVTEGPFGRAPCRFTIAGSETLRLSNSRTQSGAPKLRALEGGRARSALVCRDRTSLRLVT